MKKTLLVIGILGIAVLAFGIVGFAFAQNQNPEYPFGHGMMGDYDEHGPGMMGKFDEGGYGHGMMGDHDDHGPGMMSNFDEGGYGHGMMGFNDEHGSMHESMIAALAEALGLTPKELESRHDAGETLWEIAEAEGLSAEEIQALMVSAHDSAVEDAVASGLITEEQAEWMDSHMDQMWRGDYEAGGFGGHCGGGN